MLVAVLWTVALLSALAMAAGTSMRGLAGLHAIDRDRVQAEALLSAGLEAAGVLLLEYGERPLAPVETRLRLSTGVVRVRLSDELGRIDVNRAPVEMFTALFAEAGVPGGDEIARAIVLWRDGARKPVATEEARRVERPFTHVAQLAQVPAMTAEYARLLAPFTTVYGDETVNAATAEPWVLRALPGMNAYRVERLLEARRAPRLDAATIAEILGPAAKYAKKMGGAVARLEIEAVLPNGYATRAEAVIVASAGESEPYRILHFAQASAPSSFGRRDF